MMSTSPHVDQQLLDRALADVLGEPYKPEPKTAPTQPVLEVNHAAGVDVTLEPALYEDYTLDVFCSESDRTPVEIKTDKLYPTTLLDWALSCATRDWHVLRLRERDKNPATSSGVLDATNDPAVIREWWKENPNFNYGVAGGDGSNLVVFDIDDATPEEEAVLGLPVTFQVKSGRTPKSGMVQPSHRYYRGSCRTRTLFATPVNPVTQREVVNEKTGKTGLQFVDAHGRVVGKKNRVAIGEVRSRNAYVVGPGSVHPSGNHYVIINEAPLADSPEQNADEVQEFTGEVSDEIESIADYVEAAFEDSNIDYSRRHEYNHGYKWLIDCPWSLEHSGGKDVCGGGSSSAVFLLPSGALSYVCKHAHCEDTRQWEIDPTGEMDSLRGWMETNVGHKLVFRDSLPVLIDGLLAGSPEHLERVRNQSVEVIDFPDCQSSMHDEILAAVKAGKSMEEIAEETGFNRLVAESREKVAAKPEDVKYGWLSKFRGVAEMEEGDIVMVIDGVLQEGTCFIGANPGDGKTLIALAMAKAISSGTPLFGVENFSVRQARPVIYLIPESRDRAFRKRCEAFRITTDKMKFMARTISSGAALELSDPYLLEAVAQLKPVVFLDTASRFMKSSDENNAAQNRQLVNDVTTLLATGAVCVVILHHATKASKNEAMDLQNMLRGTSDLAAMCDATFGIRKDESLHNNGAGPLEIDMVNLKDREMTGELTQIRLAASYRKEGIAFPVSHINEVGNFVVLGEELQRRVSDKILTIVQQEPDIPGKDLASRVGESYFQVKKVLLAHGYHRVIGGPSGSSPWHQDLDKPCPYAKPSEAETLQAAVTWLKARLTTGPNGEAISGLREADVLTRADLAGFDERQLKRAAKRVGVRIDRKTKVWSLSTELARVEGVIVE